MPKRIAITIAGAVSLGSYEAGVLYELLEAIRTHNEAADARGDAEGKIYIDVLTGASAGGMTAAMVAERLMFDREGLKGEFNNVLYQAWVKQISLWGLVRLKLKEPRWHSLFSSTLIDTMGLTLLVESMKKKGLSGPHPAVEQGSGGPQPLRVGLALTNLNGINYTIPIAGNDNGGFNYTTSADQKRFMIPPTSQIDYPTLCAAAVGSGAFPVAFRSKAVDHSVEEYLNRGIKRLPADKKDIVLGQTYVAWEGHSPRPFAHADGGVLQNQPLGIARDLVFDSVLEREASGEGIRAHCDANDRLYVFVAPHSVLSSQEDELKAEKIPIRAMLRQLVKVYLRQATFHDWITAENLNQDIRQLDLRAVQLAEVIGEGKLNVSALAEAAGQINNLLNPDGPERAVARLREQYSQPYSHVVATRGTDAADAFVTAIAVLEGAANLQDNDKMKIVAVIARESELAGAGLAAFAGFFNQKFREHDYYVGRVKTRKYLLRTDVKSILGVSAWPDENQWKTSPLQDPSGVKLPVTGWQLVRAGFWPAVWMAVIRPALWIVPLIAVALLVGAWELYRYLR